jgi:hypothetical protein
MAKLLSGSSLRAGGSNTFINLAGAQPQLTTSSSTSTGFTINTDANLVTTYRSSLGNLEMNSGTIFNNIPNGNITLAGTGTGFVFVSSSTASTSTTSGALVVAGGIGVGGSIWTAQDIHVNGLTIGQGFKGINNIVIQGTATTQINEFSNGQASIVIGNDSLKGLSTTYKSIAIGNYALSSGTEIRNSIAIGDSALKATGSIQYVLAAAITDITKASPARVTASGHGLVTGTYITIVGVTGMTQINELKCYAKVIDSSTLDLYSNVIVTTPINSTGYSTYTGSGTVNRLLTRDNNIGIGNNAGAKLIDGEQNFFFGDSVAKNLTTGSYNFIIGHNVGQNLITGSGIIGIGGDNLVDGVDNQINIGSMFYYNGLGHLELITDTTVGLGTPCGTDTAALWVIGGANIENDVCIGSTETAISTTTGALQVVGGASFGKDVWIGQDLTVLGVINGAINTTTNIRGGERGSIPFQTSTGITSLLPIGATGTVLVSDGLVPYWSNAGGAGGQGIISTSTEALFVHETTTNNVYYVGLSESIGNYARFDGDSTLKYVTTSSNANTSTYYSSGTNVLNVPGTIYSSTGNPDEYNLLYSPKVTLSDIAPTNPRVGDFWIDTVNGVELQWIKDGTNAFWIQFAGL